MRWFMTVGLIFLTSQIAAALPESVLPIHPSQGHVGRTLYIDFSPDGKFLATAGTDRTVKVWNIKTGQVVRILRHGAAADYITFSHDGKRMVTVGDDKIMKVWDTTEWKKVEEMSIEHQATGIGGYGGGGISLSCDFSRAAVLKGPIVEVWDLKERKKIFADNANVSAREKGYGKCSWVGNYNYHPICLSTDGKILAATVFRWYPELVRVWDVDSGKLLFDLKGHGHSCSTCVTFSPDGKFLVSGSRDTTVIVWDLKTGEMVHRFFGPKEWAWVESVAVSPDGKLVAAGYFGEEWARVFNVKAKKQIAKLDCTPLWVDSPVSAERIAFSKDGKFLAIASGEAVGIWETKQWKLLKVLHSAIRDTLCAQFLSNNGRFICWGDYYGYVRMFDIDGRKGVTFNLPHDKPVSAIASSVDGKFIASGDESGNVSVFDVSSRKMLGKWRSHQRPIRSLAFSPDGKILATGGWDGRVRLWDVDSRGMKGEFCGKIMVIPNPAYCLDFSSDGRMLAVGHIDGVRIWDVSNGELVKWAGEFGVVRALKFVPKVSFLIFSSWTKEATFVLDGGKGWQQIGVAISDLRGKGKFAIAVSPDGSVAALAGRDGVISFVAIDELVKAKELKEVRQMQEWKSHDAFVASLDFSSDGNLLVSSGTDGVVRVWETQTGKLVLELASFGSGEDDIAVRSGGD